MTVSVLVLSSPSDGAIIARSLREYEALFGTLSVDGIPPALSKNPGCRGVLRTFHPFISPHSPKLEAYDETRTNTSYNTAGSIRHILNLTASQCTPVDPYLKRPPVVECSEARSPAQS